jgi:hypothetical protein
MTGADLINRAAEAEVQAAMLSEQAAQLLALSEENLAQARARRDELRGLSDVSRVWLSRLYRMAEDASRGAARSERIRLVHPAPGSRIVVGDPQR